MVTSSEIKIKDALRDELESKIKEFTDAGGKIEVCETGKASAGIVGKAATEEDNAFASGEY